MAEVALLNLYVAYKKSNVGLGLDSDVLACAKKFEVVLRRESESGKNLLKELHYDILVKLKFAFRELGKANNAFIGFHDRIFKNEIKLVSTPQQISKLFEEFIKGITYFRQQLDSREPFPVYHRMHACGPVLKGDGDMEYRNGNMICPGGLPRSEVNRRKVLTERCYIERLIYDSLYRHYALHHPLKGNAEMEQDEDHVKRLEMVKKDYVTCFPNMKVRVDIRYESGYPTRLDIRKYKNDVLICSETFVKTLGDLNNRFCVYEPGVYCQRMQSRGGGETKTFAKVNLYDMEQDWKGVDQSKLPLVVDGVV